MQEINLNNLTALLDAIKLQAKQYNEAFKTLEFESNEAKAERKKLRDDAIGLKNAADSGINAVKNTASDMLGALESKLELIEKVYAELHQVNVLKEDFKTITKQLDAKAGEMNLLLSSVQNAIRQQIDQELSTLQSKAEAILEKAIAKVVVVEQKTIAAADQNRRLFTMLSEDVQTLKDSMAIDGTPTGNEIIRIRTEFALVKEELENRIKTLEDQKNADEEAANARKNASADNPSDFRKELDEAKKKMNQIVRNSEANAKKTGAAMIVGVAASALAFIALVFLLLK